MIRFYVYAVIFNLGILIFVHELGHYLAARAAGVTVERFSIGFGPRILRFTRGATEYALSVIPFGGYVKMAGMEPPDTSSGESIGPDTFLGKKIGVRALIVASGPVTNFVWAVLVTVGVLLVWGLQTYGEPIVGEVDDGSPAAEAGFELGDRILSVNGESVSDWEGVEELVTSDDDGLVTISVARGNDGGSTVEFEVDVTSDDANARFGITPFAPPVVGDVMSGGPADRAGLKSGDRIVSIDGTPIRTWNELGRMIHERPGVETPVVWERGGDTLRAVVIPEEGQEPVSTTEVRTVGLIGIMRPLHIKRLGPGEAFETAIGFSIFNLRMICEFFVGLATGRVSGEMVGGPIRVVQIASESARWGMSYFFVFMAFMSLNLFLINMLPLPILDGGHLLLLGLEKLRGRRLTERQLAVWQQVGLVFFASVMILLLVLDTLRLR